MGRLLFLYITCKDEEEALSISKTLLQEHLIACANIMRPHLSLYRWEAKLEQQQESAAILKTTEELFDRVKTRIKELHSYDTPCIVGWPLSHSDQDFTDFIDQCVS